jgi:hypothetical protein
MHTGFGMTFELEQELIRASVGRGGVSANRRCEVVFGDPDTGTDIKRGTHMRSVR